MADTLTLATFNLEDLDDAPGQLPPLAERIEVLRPQLLRTQADILFLQEVNGQPAKAPRTLAPTARFVLIRIDGVCWGRCGTSSRSSSRGLL